MCLETLKRIFTNYKPTLTQAEADACQLHAEINRDYLVRRRTRIIWAMAWQLVSIAVSIYDVSQISESFDEVSNKTIIGIYSIKISMLFYRVLELMIMGISLHLWNYYTSSLRWSMLSAGMMIIGRYIFLLIPFQRVLFNFDTSITKELDASFSFLMFMLEFYTPNLLLLFTLRETSMTLSGFFEQDTQHKPLHDLYRMLNIVYIPIMAFIYAIVWNISLYMYIIGAAVFWICGLICDFYTRTEFMRLSRVWADVSWLVMMYFIIVYFNALDTALDIIFTGFTQYAMLKLYLEDILAYTYYNDLQYMQLPNMDVN